MHRAWSPRRCCPTWPTGRCWPPWSWRPTSHGRRPACLPANVFAAGNPDTRKQRSALLDALARSAASRLLIACDARQTPDRGTLALLAELSDKAAQTRVWLLQAGAAGAGQGRGSLWQARLLDAGLPEAAILRDADHPLRWLEAAHD